MILTAISLLLTIFTLSGQHYIGLSKEQTRTQARSSGFYPDNMTTSQSFNYLKFVNSAGTKTLIVFFSDEDLSTHTKMVCDYTEYDFVIKAHDREYIRKGKTTWEYRKNEQWYQVDLEEGDWYFTVRVKKK